MLTLTMASFISMLAFLIMRNWIFISLFNDRDNNMRALILVYVVSIVVWLVSTLLTRALSRYREFAADRGSAVLTGNPRALISALTKISGRMDYIPAEKKQEIEGANAFFIIPALSGNTLMELSPPTRPSRSGWLYARNWRRRCGTTDPASPTHRSAIWTINSRVFPGRMPPSFTPPGRCRGMPTRGRAVVIGPG